VHETPVRAHQEAAFRLAHAGEVAHLAVAHAVFDGARGRHQAGGEAVEQRRLAGAGFADDRQDFARPEIEGDILAADARAVEFRDVADFESGVVGHSAASLL
jgi:hypothetical protein